MKNYLKYCWLPFVATVLMISCQEENDFLELEEDAADTRVINEKSEIIDYYWADGEKHYIKQVPDKTFLLYLTEKQNKLNAVLSRNNLSFDISKIKEFDNEGTDKSGKAAKWFDNCKWIEVNANVTHFKDYEEIIYAAPYYLSLDSGEPFPMTNLVYVQLKDKEKLFILEQMAEDLQVGIVGKYKGLTDMYIVGCTKESKGNALEIANILYESGCFAVSCPAFMSIKLALNDTFISDQWNLGTISQYGINYSSASSLMPSSSSIKVAVIDSGVDLTHPDLRLNSFSWNAQTSSSPSTTYNDHGTAVAGIICAETNNGMGIAGITKDVEVMSISFDPNSSTSEAAAASAITKATDMGASVINISWVSDIYLSLINSAINYAITNGRNGKGCIVVCAAGNDGGSSVCFPSNHVPADYVIAVGASDASGVRAVGYYDYITNSYLTSNYGSNLDIVAPGVNIPTTRRTIFTLPYTTNFTGTSAAAPHVSAVAAEILTINNSLDYDQVQYIIKNTAYKLPSYTYSGGRNNYVGYGLLDAYSALDMTYSTYSTTQSFSLSGPSSLVVDSSGYASTQIYASPSNLSYTYFWSISFDGEYDRYYLWPIGSNNHSPSADVSIYLNPGDAGGRVEINCNVYYGSAFLGSATKFIYVN